MILQQDEKIYGINYIPECLTEREEQECIRLIKEGDVEARGKLIEGNLRLANYIAKGYMNTNIEDLENVGVIGLINAVDNFKSDMNVKISTYASTCIRNEINKCCKYNRRHPNYNAVDTNVFNELPYHERYDCYENKELFKGVLENILNELTSKRKICILYKIADYSNTQIADKFNVSNSYIARIVRQARQELKELLSVNCKDKRFNVEIKDNNFYKISFEVPETRIHKKVQQNISKSRYSFVSNSKGKIEVCIDLEKEAFELLAEIIQIIENF